MAYTPPTLKNLATIPNIGPLVTDANRVSLTGAVGNAISTIDATGTPVTSPVTVNTTKTLVVPTNAVSCVITSVTNAVQVSEDSTQTAFFTLPAALVWEFECARLANIYLKTGSSTVVSFYFKTV